MRELADALAFLPGALALDGTAFRAFVAHPAAGRATLVVLLAAGLASVLGQSVALFANRVPPKRFVAALLYGAGAFVVSATLLGVAVAIASGQLYGTVDTRAVLRVVGLAHAPLLLSFLVLIPYFGPAIHLTLGAWTVLALAVGGSAVFALTLGEAALALAAGWAAANLVERLSGRALRASMRLRRRWGLR